MPAEKNHTEIICRIVSEYSMGEVKATPEASLESLGLDSLDTIEVVMEIEEEYDINIHDEEYENVKTVQDIIDLIERRMA